MVEITVDMLLQAKVLHWKLQHLIPIPRKMREFLLPRIASKDSKDYLEKNYNKEVEKSRKGRKHVRNLQQQYWLACEEAWHIIELCVQAGT